MNPPKAPEAAAMACNRAAVMAEAADAGIYMEYGRRSGAPACKMFTQSAAAVEDGRTFCSRGETNAMTSTMRSN
jgi:hypothetical protein